MNSEWDKIGLESKNNNRVFMTFIERFLVPPHGLEPRTY